MKTKKKMSVVPLRKVKFTQMKQTLDFQFQSHRSQLIGIPPPPSIFSIFIDTQGDDCRIEINCFAYHQEVNVWVWFETFFFLKKTLLASIVRMIYIANESSWSDKQKKEREREHVDIFFKQSFFATLFFCAEKKEHTSKCMIFCKCFSRLSDLIAHLALNNRT